MSGWRRSANIFLIALLSIGAAEFGARTYWRLFDNIPLRDPGRVLYILYPELRAIDHAHPTRDDKFYDVLLLGGSVLNKRWGRVQQDLAEALASSGRRNVRIFNLAMPAHTSRDSLIKYEALSDARFELVIFYHAINETRANNVPPQLFREDYSHYSWYELANNLAPRSATQVALPYTLSYLRIRVGQWLRSDKYVPTHSPREEWTAYGSKPRSAASFKQNLSTILDLAKQRGDRMLLMTFAIYVPENYSLEAFQAKRLDYGLHLTPIELWGRQEHVVAAMAVHNEIVRSLATRDQVLFVDQANLMRSNVYFDDICHLTAVGSARFVENILEVLSQHPPNPIE